MDVNGFVEVVDFDGLFIIVVFGFIFGSVKVCVGLDKIIFGELGSCKLLIRGVEIERFIDYYIISIEWYWFICMEG